MTFVLMSSTTWTTLPLIGRESELAAMRRGLVSAARGACTLRVIAGSHGIGKTRLLDATIADARSQGFVVARCTAWQSDINVPYSVISDALTPLVRGLDPGAVRTMTRGGDAELAQIIPALGDGVERANRGTEGDLTPRLRWHATQFLSKLSARAPILFAVDNAHWADPSSIALLHFVLRNAGDAKVMIAAAFNTLEAESSAPIRWMVKTTVGMPEVEQLTLAPLTVEDIVALLAQRFDVEAARVADFGGFLHQRTLGNPFFVEETIKALVERGTLHRTGDQWTGWDVDDIDVPATIREVLLERVNALEAPSRTVADLASVIGSRASNSLLRSASGLEASEFLDAINGLRRANVLAEIEEGGDILYDFTHPLLQRTLYEETGAARRRELHALVARKLEEHFGEDALRHATELSYHYVRANAPTLTAKSIQYLVQAGRNALAMHADREATRYLQHALDLIDRGGQSADDTLTLPDLVETLARARQRIGEHDVARGLWIRARELCAAADDRAGLARIERRIGLLLFWSGNAHLAVERYDAALLHARAVSRLDLEARILVTKGAALMALGKPDEAKHQVHSALDAVQQGDASLKARVQHALLMLYAYAGPADVANEMARRLQHESEAAGELHMAWAAHHATAVLACFTANAESVAHHVAEGDRLAKQLHSPVLSAQIAEVAIEYASAKGDWAEGLALAERSIPVARAMSPRSLLPRLLVWTGTILLNRDEIEKAKACFDEAWELSRAGAADSSGADLNAVIVAYIGQAAYHLTTRDWLSSIEFAQRGIDIADRHGMTSWTLHRLLPMLSEAALWVGDFALAEQAAARLRADSARFDHGLGEAWAFTVDQLVRRWRDNETGVIERLQAAADQLDQVPFVFHAARLRRHIGRLLTFGGDREGAGRELRKAHDVHLRLGAALELRLTREAMRQIGVRPPQQTVAPGRILTGRELEIVQLVAQHKTNKEIARALDISSRTVSTHLSNVFVKLGVDSRGTLADLVRDDPTFRSESRSTSRE